MADDISDIPAILRRPLPAKAAEKAKGDTPKAKATTPPQAPVTPPEAPKKAKGKGAKGEGGKPAIEPAKAAVDAYGFKLDTIKSKAAAMYASKRGATVGEVKEALGSLQLNLLKDVEKRGFTIERTKEKTGSRSVTRYKIVTK